MSMTTCTLSSLLSNKWDQTTILPVGTDHKPWKNHRLNDATVPALYSNIAQLTKAAFDFPHGHNTTVHIAVIILEA